MKNFIFIIFLFLFVSVDVSAHRENMYFLKGTIGEKQVGMEVYEHHGTCTVRYFTSDNLYDKIMEGKVLEDYRFVLSGVVWNVKGQNEAKSDSLFLKLVNIDYWNGKFKTADGNELKVELKRLRLDSINHPYPAVVKQFNITPYEAYKTRNVEFKKGKKKKFTKNIKVQKVVDPASRVEWFRLVSKLGSVKVDSMNMRLTAEHLKYILSKYSLGSELTNENFKLSYNIQFLSDQIISYITRYDVSIQGATGKEEIGYQTNALSSGKKLLIEDLFWFGDEPRPHLIQGEYKWTQYRIHSFGPKVYKILEELYPDKFAEDNSGPCRYNELRIWYYPEWYLTKEGLVLLSKSTFSNRNCEQKPQGEIPFTQLKPYWENSAFTFD